MTDHPPDDTLADLEALDLFQRHGNAQRRLHLEFGARFVEQEHGGRVERHQGVHALQDLLQRPIEVERGAQCRADLGQKPVRGGRRGAAAGEDAEPACIELARALRHAPENR